MAKVEDVVVSDRVWRWRSCPMTGMPVSVGAGFVITAVDGERAWYRYASGERCTRLAVTIAAHAEPDPLPEPARCEADCMPGVPCFTHQGCPGNGPEYRVLRRHSPVPVTLASTPGLESVLAGTHAPSTPPACRGSETSTRRGAGEREHTELRCGRELACGLFRVP